MEEKINQKAIGEKDRSFQSQPVGPDKLNGKFGLWLAVFVIIVAMAGIWAYNFWIGDRSGGKQVSTASDFPISREQVRLDFDNRERKERSEVTPPESYIERFSDSLNKSLTAVESGIPSQPDFRDLNEDYLNIASIYSILGDYQKSEEWYLKTIEKWPKEYKATMNLGDLYILMGQLQLSADRFYDTVENYPTDFTIYNKFADFYYKYSKAEDKIKKAEMIYEKGIEMAKDPKMVYKNYVFFLENYVHDFGRAAQMERGYQKVSGEQNPGEIERLEKMIK